MAQTQHAARGKMFRPTVIFVVIYCVCAWSTVCFSSIEANPLPRPRQNNINGTTGNEGTLIDGIIAAIITSTVVLIGALCGPIIAVIVSYKCFQHPKITQSPENITVAAGQTTELKCEASGKPAPNFQWFMENGCDVAGSTGVTIKTGNGHSTLTINNIQESHAGKYGCRAFNFFSCCDDNRYATITVAGPPTITQNPGTAMVISGSETSFTCVASSDLPMEFSWQKDDDSIIFYPSITVNTSGNMSTLTLEHVSTTDVGSYTCIVSNDAGPVTSNAAILQVTGGVIEKLKQCIPDNPPSWDPLPDCKSPVELAMIRVNRKEEQHPNTERVKNQVYGNVEKIMESPAAVEVKACRIFDKGIFKNDGSIILLEGGPGMGKTTLGYSYCKKWKDGVLHEFDMAAFVALREIDKEKVATFDDLLFLACGNDKVMKVELKQYMESGKSLFLVLDGWDEAPDIVRKSPSKFIDMLQRSIPPRSKSKILITSRPDSSADLVVNRVEIVGFTMDSIKEYFDEALRSSLNEHEIEDGRKKLENHLKTYPSIQSCCAIPLNAAIVASLFLAKPRTLPHTRHELFSSIIAHLINKEQEKRCASAHKVSYISSLEKLSDSLKKPLCKLAFENLKEIVIPHERVPTELVEHESANPIDASFNSAKSILSPCLGAVLQTVKKRDPRSGGITEYHYFIHLSIQELLAAYHISQLGEDEQVKVFKDLLYEPRFSSVLQFYAAFTRFTNRGVQDIVTRIDLANKQHIVLTIMRCCFEANIQDQVLFQKIKQSLNGRLCIMFVALTPFDCMSVGYFLAFALRTGELLNVTLPFCGIDDHSLGLLLGELSRHAETCPPGDVLKGITELSIKKNNIGDDGIARLATALQANTTMKILDIRSNRGIAVNGANSLARALSVNSSLENLDISHTSIGDEGIAHITNALQTNTTMKVLNVAYCGMSCKGAESLARALTPSSSLEKLYISDNKFGDDGIAHIATALKTNNTLNSLVFDYDGNATDKAALSVAAALTTNTSMEYIHMGWLSTHPDTTLKKVAGYVRKSTLRKLALDMFRPSREPRISVEEEIEWLQQVKVGGKEFILSLEDSRAHLESFSLDIILKSSVHDLRSQVRMSLKGAATSVNMTRKMNNLPEIKFDIM